MRTRGTRMRTVGPLAAGAAVLLAGLGACFSQDPAETVLTCDDAPASVTVVIRDYRFDPPVACVAEGGTVTWVNAGAEAHTATGAEPADLWDSGLLASDEEFTHTFEDAGEFPYFCIPHPFMQAVVIVE